MPDPLEEFLEKTARLRQQKNIQQRAEASQQAQRDAARRPRPYSDRRRERVAQIVDDLIEPDEEPIEVVEATVVDEDSSSGGRPTETTAGSDSEAMRAELLRMLKRPDGVRQAFLLREILERPKF